MFRLKNKVDLLILVLVFMISLLVWNYIKNSQGYPQSPQNNSINLFATPEPTPIPTPILKSGSKSQDSADGSMIVTVKTLETRDNKMEYSLTVTSSKEDIEKAEVFSETVAKHTNIEIPFNSWSPDNKHFFIKKQNGETQEYLVFKATGAKFAENQFINATAIFIESEIPYDLDEITGWAAPYLLVTRTQDKETQEASSSYWFDVSTQRYIRLNSRF